MVKVFKEKVVAVKIIILFFIIVSLLSCETSQPEEKASQNTTDANGIKIVDVDKVVRKPDSYKDYFGVSGVVLKAYEEKGAFVLSCGDACIRFPVHYSGEMPKAKDKIIAYGQIKTNERGNLFFDADKVKPQ